MQAGLENDPPGPGAWRIEPLQQQAHRLGAHQLGVSRHGRERRTLQLRLRYVVEAGQGYIPAGSRPAARCFVNSRICGLSRSTSDTVARDNPLSVATSLILTRRNSRPSRSIYWIPYRVAPAAPRQNLCRWSGI
jgi:hypothetical protein